MKTVRSYILVDEVKDVQDSGPCIFLFGVGIPENAVDAIGTKLSIVVHPFGSNGFHAKDSYKEKSANLDLMNEMTGIISSFHLPCFCFPFAKHWLADPRLDVLQKMEFKGWQPNMSNYEFVAFYLFLHCLNSFLSGQNYLKQTSRLVCHQGIRDAREGFSFEESETLNTIENVIFASRKQCPLLALPDHLGYLFGKCRRDLLRDGGEINLEPNENNTPVQNECVKHTTSLTKAGLFYPINLWEWVDYKNKTADKLKVNVGSAE